MNRPVSSAAALADLSAVDALDGLKRGLFTAEALTTACLDRIAERDGEIRAFAHVDRELALGQATIADLRRRAGESLGPLHGIPVGVKDIIDTADLPTENGCLIDAGRRPTKDATVVSRLRAAGAVVIGKTVTTELAFLAPSPTRNPRNPDHTPGGSSSGSAAAVAAAMVPLAIGTQTGGSVIRPAAYCGVVGFKPTFGLISRAGVLRHSPWLDTIGTFGRSIEDAALLADVLAGYDPADSATRPAAPPDLLATVRSEPPVPPEFIFVRTPAWKDISADSEKAFAELVEALGARCETVDLPEIFAEGAAAQARLARVGMARSLREYYDRGADRLAPESRRAIEEGRTVSGVDYVTALDWREILNDALEEVFYRYDAIITPAATGAAPKGFATTGSPAFNVLWTLTGVPALTLPLMADADGLPIGVQLVGRRGNDGRLLRSARWLAGHLAGLDHQESSDG